MKTLKQLAILVLLFAVRSGGASGQTLTTLHQFSQTGGAYSGLIQASDGNFYGTTGYGGTSSSGSVYRISPSGNFTNIHSFSGNDGGMPQGGLVQGNDGNFYGVTFGGGCTNCYVFGCGTVFRISPSGGFTILHTFSGSNDGSYPEDRLIQGTDGNFYGTTSGGGSSNCFDGCGTVFRISPSGDFTNLYFFSGGIDGFRPEAGLVQGSDGSFYGATGVGGLSGSGAIYRISSSGSFTNLHSFNGSDGAYPRSALVRGSDGNFYGRTYGGGDYYKGTVFRITPSGDFTSLHSFDLGYAAAPLAGLVQGSDGNFYGTTYNGWGTIFRISPSGEYSNVYSFNGGNDGYNPSAGLVQACDGNFYGTTSYGGLNFVGTVFKLSIPLNPPANQISGIQLVGADVILTIPSVAGETYQLQYRDSISSGDWTNVDNASVTNSIGGLLTLTNFDGALLPQAFYRFTITP